MLKYVFDFSQRREFTELVDYPLYNSGGIPQFWEADKRLDIKEWSILSFITQTQNKSYYTFINSQVLYYETVNLEKIANERKVVQITIPLIVSYFKIFDKGKSGMSERSIQRAIQNLYLYGYLVSGGKGHKGYSPPLKAGLYYTDFRKWLKENKDHIIFSRLGNIEALKYHKLIE